MKDILLVFGGSSYEHDISVVTAFQIYKKTRLSDMQLIPLYISRDKKFFICDVKKLHLSDFSKTKFNAKNKAFKEVFFVSGENKKLFIKTRFGLKEFIESSVAIFACHGADGENGKLVNLFEYYGIACSAGNSDALAICMDKMLFKTYAKGLKIPVVHGFKINKFSYELETDKINKQVLKYGFPLIIKINSGGSSIGLFIAKNLEEFNLKIKEAFEFDENVVVEKFIKDAREFNIAILGDEKQYEISEIDEPIKENEVLTFADKYLRKDGKQGKGSKNSMVSSFRKFPAEINEDIASKIKTIAQKLFLSLGLYGVIRIDFLYEEKIEKLYVCEVNAIPGSLAYYFFKKNKIVTNDLITRLCKIAEDNFKENKIKSDFIVNILDN